MALICSGLRVDSLTQLIRCLERMPHVSDPQMILWDLPETLQSPFLYLNLLDSIRRERHWMWTGLLNSVGGSDLILDRFFLYIDSVSLRAGLQGLESRLIAIEIYCQVIIERPPPEDRFLDAFDRLFHRLTNLMTDPGPIALQIHCFRCAVRILQKTKYRFSDSAYIDYWFSFAEMAVKQIFLRPLVLRLMQTNFFCEFSMTTFGRILFQNHPDHNDIWVISNLISNSKSKTDDRPLSVLQSVALLSVTDEVLARTCCRSLPLLIKAMECEIPWLRSFLKKAAGFVIVAQNRQLCPYQVGLVIELFLALFKMQVDWIQSEISIQAAILLGSQKVPMAIVSVLKPAMRFETAELHQWEGAHGRELDLRTIFLSAREEPVPRLPFVQSNNICSRKRTARIGTISLPSFATINCVITQRAKARRCPAKPVLKNARFAQLSIRH
jgi:hypothetical protein